MKFDLSCPVEIKEFVFSGEENAIRAKLFNLTQKTITSIKYSLITFDEDGNESSRHSGSLENIVFAPRETFDAIIEASDIENAEISFDEFTFDDESTFEPSGQMTDIEIPALSDAEKSRFERAGITDAVCFAKADVSHWLCVCGRPNHVAAESCIRCEREKEFVMKNYSSEESVAAAILKKEELDVIEAEKKAALLLEEKAQKKAEQIKKLKKIGTYAGVVVAALLVLSLCLKLVFTLIGNSAASKGNYAKAAKMYEIAMSSKFDDVADEYYGNSATNLVYMGIMAEDDKNIYYVNDAFNVFSQNKETGEKTALYGIMGRSLSASGGHLYYLGIVDNLIYKVLPDGTGSEVIYDKPAYYFNTAGNDVYFIADAPINAQDMTQEEMMMQNPYALYVLKDGETEPELISTNNIGAFDIYKDKIYYMDFSDNYNLYSMSLNGKGAKKIIEASVNSFEVDNGKIYYTDSTVPQDSETGMPALALEVANLNGRHKETLINDAMVSMFSVSGDTVYYTDYNTQGVLYKLGKGNEPLIAANNVSLFNACGDHIQYLTNDGYLFLTKHDLSGYDEIASIGSAAAEE